MKKISLFMLFFALFSQAAMHKVDSNGVMMTDAAAVWYGVYDDETNLFWESKTGVTSKSQLSWEEALEYCNNLTFLEKSDWRLPNINELKSILDYTISDPVINTTYFLNTENMLFLWSSTTYVPTSTPDDVSRKWHFNIVNGLIFYEQMDTSTGHNAMCVRGGIN